MGEAGRSGIPFLRMGGVLLGLGDPAGAPTDRISAIWRLRDLAAQEGLDPAVWRAGPTLLKVYGDLGLTALPLGSDGRLLPENADAEPDTAEYLCCVAERDLVRLEPAVGAPRSNDRVGPRGGVTRLDHRVTAQDHQRARHLLHRLVVLVARDGAKHDDAAVGFGPRRPHLRHVAHGVETRRRAAPGRTSRYR